MTDRGVDAETAPMVAVMVVEPMVFAVARPFEPEMLLTVATPLLSEDQVTEAVMSCVEASENVPVAESCSVEPSPMVGFEGVTAMDVSAFTVKVLEPETPRVALMVAEPAATAVALPREPEALLMVATALFDELQVTNVVKSWTKPSENVPVAVNCWVEPTTALGPAGVTVMDKGP